jgi:DNA-binding response OmpR family regulator
MPTKAHDLYWIMEERGLMIGSKVVHFSQREWEILCTLRSLAPVTYEYISRAVYNCRADEKVRIMLDKHIDRIRVKLSKSGMYVHCVLGYGYVLLPSTAVKKGKAGSPNEN